MVARFRKLGTVIFICIFSLTSRLSNSQGNQFSSAGYRTSGFVYSSESSVVDDFSQFGTGDVLTFDRTILSWENFLFHASTQDSQGVERAKFFGPRFQHGTPNAQIPTQYSAAISQLSSINLNNDSKMDLIAITSAGEIFAYANKGQSSFENGFDDIDLSQDAWRVFDFSNPANPQNTLAYKTHYTVLRNGDFNQDGCEDFVVGGVGINDPINNTENSLGLYVFWCSSSGGFFADPQWIDLGLSYAIDLRWHKQSQTIYVLGQEPSLAAGTPTNTTLTAIRFIGAPQIGSGVTQSLNQQWQIGFPGQPNSLAIGEYTQDGFLDFLISGNTSNVSATQSQGIIWLYPGARSQTVDFPNVSVMSLLPTNINAVEFDLIGVNTADINNDGIEDFSAIVAYGINMLNGQTPNKAEIIYGYGPLNNISTTYTTQLSGYYGLLSKDYLANFPQYKSITDVLHFWDTNRDGYLDIIVSGVNEYYNQNNTFTFVSKGTETFLNQGSPSSTPTRYIRDFGQYETTPRSNGQNANVTIGLSGGAPVLGANLHLVLKDLSPGQYVGFNYDTTASNFSFLTPSLWGTSKPIWIGALPQFSSSSYFVSPNQNTNKFYIEKNFNIPNNLSLLGFEGYIQAILFDPVTGYYYSSQGIEFKVGN